MACAWYLAAHHHGQLVLLPFAILALTALISYQRAKAELLGLSATGGLMERAERFILLGVCFIAGAVSPAAFVPALWVFFGLITATALGPVRPGVAGGRGSGADTVRPSPARPCSRARHWPVGEPPGSIRRWRTWRETRRERDATGVHFVQPQRADQPLGRWRARRQSVIGQPIGSDLAGAGAPAAP